MKTDTVCEYIVDSSLIRTTDKSIGLPVGRKGSFHVVDTVWFPLSVVKVKHMTYGTSVITIPEWILNKYRTEGKLLSGFDIIEF